MTQDTEANRLQALGYSAEERALAEPLSTGLFAGAFDPSKTSYLAGLALKAYGGQPGDFRDWGAIRTWAEALADKLLA
jgi:menaquinone-dependent protoporphyrinogen oxidase